jgi:hypothetical protein
MPRRRLKHAVTALAVAGLAFGTGGVTAASAETYSFESVRAKRGVVTFAIAGVHPARVRSASVRLGARPSRRLSLARARRAVRTGALRLRVKRTSRKRGARTRRIRGRASLTIVSASAAPETTIKSGPNGVVGSSAATFSFDSSQRPARFDCRLDLGPWGSCSSPRSYTGLAEGAHSFQVRARSKRGELDLTPATRGWTVDLPEPGPAPTPVPAPTEPTPSEPLPSEPPVSGALLFDGFGSANGSNNLITNEYAGWHALDGTAVHSPVWRSDGGSLFSVAATDASGNADRVAYTGKLDNGFADKYSQTNTHSNKMRFWTKSSGFGDVRVDVDIRPTAWGPDAPASWAGFKFYLRRELGLSDSAFYTVEPIIKDGSVYIQKKCLGDTGGGNYSAGGTYYLLASKRVDAALGGWQRISASSRTNSDGSVTLSLHRDGTLLMQAVDRGIRSDGSGCAPLRAGHVGFRSDYLQYYLDDYKVSALS